jgi:heme-degrading monooxygenase HmoA
VHATVRHYSGSPGFADALVERESDVRSLIQEIDGFRAYYLIKVGDDETVTVSVFDDASGADESVRRAAEWIRENLSDLSVQPPQVSSGEVAIQF